VLDFKEIDNKSLGGIAQHLFETMAINGGFDIYGKTETVGTLREDHHKLEAFCKAFGRTLHRATQITSSSDMIPSTKGIL
jgi:imidazoleglycerol phosphate dehydratase HisB